jgi:hypothetical protein
MPNNREWALLFWLAVILVFLLMRKNTRSSIGGVLRIALSPKFLVPLAIFVGYVALEVRIGFSAGLWRGDLTKDTIVWILIAGLALFFNFDEVSKEPHYFRNRIAAAFGITTFLEFFTNLFVLNLIAELALQPVLVFLALLAMAAGRDGQYRDIKGLANIILTLIVLSLFIFAVQQIFTNWEKVDKQGLLLQLALPIWLTIGVLPFIYLLSLYANYERAFSGVNWATRDRRSRWRAKLAMVSKFHFRTRELRRIPWTWAQRASDAQSLSAARTVIDEFRKSRRAVARAVIEEQERLQRYAGSDEVDVEGRRLDRREFKETTSALRWLATCQMGWYHNEDRGGRYRADLLEAVLGDFTNHGLPPDSGITMKVAMDGQAWYAWRRTVSGWCFAIGAVGPPPDQWEYDGPEPPTHFPGQDESWGINPSSSGVNANW